MLNDLSRRNFLTHAGGAVSAIWLTSHWPAIVAAAEHAHQAAKSSAPAKFKFLTPEEAAEVDAIASRIIPSDDTPGAHEAGVVYFIDYALTTFAVDDQKTYRDGLPALQARTRQLFPDVAKYSAATPAQQDQILQALDETAATGGRAARRRVVGGSFFQTLRVHTIIGFLIDPESGTGGNLDGVGWKLIGRDPEHMFQPPFGYYDKDYAGWQPNPPVTDKAKV